MSLELDDPRLPLDDREMTERFDALQRRLVPLWHAIENLDNKIPATIQQEMLFDVSRILRHASYWLIERYGNDLDIVAAVAHLKDNMSTIYARASSIVSGAGKERQKSATDNYIANGVPEKLARQMAALLLTRGALDISDLANVHKKDGVETAEGSRSTTFSAKSRCGVSRSSFQMMCRPSPASDRRR